MAGVVNLITRNDYEGLGVSARYGVTDRGAGGDFTADLIWGARGDRGGIMMAATYQKTNAVNMASRAPRSLTEVPPGWLSGTNSTSTIGGTAVLPNDPQNHSHQAPGGSAN